jgi:hypothetical protein
VDIGKGNMAPIATDIILHTQHGIIAMKKKKEIP